MQNLGPIPADAKKAAVLIPVFLELGEIEISPQSKILLTKRTETVEHHKGQISFPGGRPEDSDKNLRETALRETEEEVGISRNEVDIIQELEPIFIPPTRFLVSPFVGLIHSNPAIVLNESESVESILVPIHHLLDDKNTKLETYAYNGLNFSITTYFFNEHRIWGATARMIHNFLRTLK